MWPKKAAEAYLIEAPTNTTKRLHGGVGGTSKRQYKRRAWASLRDGLLPRVALTCHRGQRPPPPPPPLNPPCRGQATLCLIQGRPSIMPRGIVATPHGWTFLFFLSYLGQVLEQAEP